MSRTVPLPRLVWLPGLALLWSGACVAPGEVGDSSESQVGVTIQEVVGGEATDPCDWPSTVDVNGCSGTLIHPRVVTTAGHCLSSFSRNGRVTFTAGTNVGGSFSLPGLCTRGGGASTGGTDRDWGYCVIPSDHRVARLPYTPPLVGCEAERFLRVGGTAWVVGFGTTGPDGQGAGIKREVEVVINAIQNGVIDVGDSEVGACHGDSGGPIYLKVGDATHDWGWRVFGSTSSTSANCDCNCGTIYVNIANHVKAIEENEGIDVTPCTNDNGEWDPTAACSAFQSTPQEGTGTYPACSVAVTTGPIETCGPGVVPVGGAGGTGGAGEDGGAELGEDDGSDAGDDRNSSTGEGSSSDAAEDGSSGADDPGDEASAGSGGVMGGTARSPAAGSAVAGGGGGSSGASGSAGAGADAGVLSPPAVTTKDADTGCQVSRVGGRARSGSSGVLACVLIFFGYALTRARATAS